MLAGGAPYGQLIRTPSGGFEHAIPANTGSRYPPQYTPFGLTAKRKRDGMMSSSQADAGVAAILGLSGLAAGWSSKSLQRTGSHNSIGSSDGGSTGGGAFSSQGFAPGFGRSPSGNETSSTRTGTPQSGGERKRKANQVSSSLKPGRSIGTSRATDPAATATVALAVATAAAVAPGGVSTSCTLHAYVIAQFGNIR